MKTDRILSFPVTMPWTSPKIIIWKQNVHVISSHHFLHWSLGYRKRGIEDLASLQTISKPPYARKRGPLPHLRVMAAGNMNPMDTAAVAPVNCKAPQMLGIK